MASSSPAAARGRIALIEDDIPMATMLCYNIEAVGHAVEWIDNGTSALAQLRAVPPTLVVLDWNLPGLSGIEITRQLRSARCTERLPVLMITGRCEDHDRRSAMAAGVDVFVAKPFAVATFISTMQGLLVGYAHSRRSEIGGTCR